MASQHFDVVVVGSGFGSLFFVDGLLSKPPQAKVLILERGTFNSHAWQLENNKNSPVPSQSTLRTAAAKKVWNFTVVQGSLRMGSDPATSVIDAKQIHHDVRNLVVVGLSVFPSGPNANPSLSVAALSLRAASLIA